MYTIWYFLLECFKYFENTEIIDKNDVKSNEMEKQLEK